MDDFIKQTTLEFYEGLTGEDAWDKAFCNYAERIGFTTTCMHLLTHDGVMLKSTFSSRLPEDTDELDYETLSFNPRFEIAKQSRDSSARIYSDRDVITAEEAASNVWYQDIGKPLDCYAWLGGFVPIMGDTGVIFAAMRGANWIDPSQEEQILMHRTLKALTGVFDTFSRLEQFNVQNALNLLGTDICICAIRRDGKLVDYNKNFAAEINRNHGISSRHNFLTFNNSENQNKLERLLNSPLSALKSFVTKPLTDGSHRRIKLLPFPWSRVGPSSVVGLLSIEAAKPAVTLDRALLKSNYKLTASEADVAELLIQGKSTEELAEERGVLVSTIRTQINALMDKMHCNSRIQLMSVLMRYT